ncbi:MAG: dienelactone hydrolase family protein [Proteobacteria bacterium]|nr:dienelactone hydrolase family protein [Pseudomonadota bacterium]
MRALATGRDRACSHPWLVACFALSCWLWMPARANAAICDGPYPVGQRGLALPDGREIALWYPAVRARSANPGEVAVDAPMATCPTRWPLLLFSHGVVGCNEQVVYLTQALAARGYVVAAPNHRDAICGIATRRAFSAPADSDRPAFLDPSVWTAKAWRERRDDLRDALRVVQSDPNLARAIDPSRIGLLGHSLGGYTVLGIAGGWPDWSLPGVRAAAAYSPFVQPFLAKHRLRALRVPVMYQGGTLDWGMTPQLLGDAGAFAVSPPPKYLVEFAGATHMLWTNGPCADYRSSQACIAADANVRGVVAYTLAFFDRYLKDAPAPLLDGKGVGVRTYRQQR